LKLICGAHNHDLSKSLEGHLYVDQLNNEEKMMLADMTEYSKAKKYLVDIQIAQWKKCEIKQVYNVRTMYRSSRRGSMMKMQHLMNLLEWDMYIRWHRMNDTSEVVHDIFWTHHDAKND